jgi:hypothetical protein
MTLTPAQQEIVRKMKAGWCLCEDNNEFCHLVAPDASSVTKAAGDDVDALVLAKALWVDMSDLYVTYFELTPAAASLDGAQDKEQL